MKSKPIGPAELQLNPVDIETTSSKSSLSEVFAERKTLFNECTLYLAHFNSIPNLIHEINIDCKRAHRWFIENYKSEIRDCHYSKRYYDKNKTAEYDDIFYILCEDLMIDFDTNSGTVRFLFRKTDFLKIEAIIREIKKFRKRRKREPNIYLIINERGSIVTRPLPIIRPKLNIKDNYNDDFKEIHEAILKRLSTKNDKGLVLLHGKPGTGKTSYIRYLVSAVKKDIIFLPPHMASAINNPDLLSFFIDHRNSIFVIEDAENLIIDREKDESSRVAALLNITDGLLSDCLGIQMICSFNTDISKIDNALMRKGRLIAKYEFKELGIDKAQVLSNKLGFSTNINAPATLAAIYNQEEKDFQQNKSARPIGYRAIQNN